MTLLSNADLVAIGAYVVAMLWIAWSTRETGHFDDYSVANRKLPAGLLFASISATYIGPGFSIGAADEAATRGFLPFLLFAPYAVHKYVVGRYLAPRLHDFRLARSIGDVFEQVYTPSSRLVVGLLATAVCVMIVGFLAMVAGTLAAAITPLAFQHAVIVVTVISLSYTLWGGIQGSVLTDAIQFVVFAALVSVIVVLALITNAPDIHKVAARVGVNTAEAWKSTGMLPAFATGLSFLLGEMLMPQSSLRAMAAESRSASETSFVWSGAFCIVWLLTISAVGFLSTGYAVPFDIGGDGEALLGLGLSVLPEGGLGLLLVAVIGILMSSQDSVLNAGAVTITRDVVGAVTDLSGLGEMRVARLGTILVGVGGIVSAGWLPDIIDALLLIYSLWAPAVLVAFVGALYKINVRPGTAVSSMVAGASGSVLWTYLAPGPTELAIIPGLFAALAALAAGKVIQLKAEEV